MEDSIECPHCGSRNKLGESTCRICGKPLAHKHEASPGSLVCESCGAPIQSDSEVCTACTRPVRAVVMSNLPEQVEPIECVHWSDKVSSSGRTARLMVAGILILISGAMGLGQAVISVTPGTGEQIGDFFVDVLPVGESINDALAEYFLLQLMILVGSIGALIGGAFTLTQARFDVSVIGGVCGILAIGFLIGAFFALVGVILIVSARKEFLPECA